MKKWLGLIILGLILIGVYGGWVRLKDKRWLRVGKEKILVEIKETEEERRLGLSGREKMALDEGMLFVFEEPGRHGFWMKGMKFDLDFVFIKDNQVVEVVEQVKAPRPDEMPRSIRPNQEIEMVLEVNSGWVHDKKIKLNDKVELRRWW